MKKLFDFFASYGFAVVVLIFLTILTLFGTLEQTTSSLFDVQNKYFNSFFLIHNLFGKIPIPLPGVYLLSVLLFINLTCGAIIRAKKDWRHPGMLIAHGGILYMLIAGFVTYHYSTSGHMTLYPQDKSNEYQSYYAWEIAVSELKDGFYAKDYLIEDKQFSDMGAKDAREFSHSDLPFTLRLENFQSNSVPAPSTDGAGVDGLRLVSRESEMNAEQNAAGVYAMVIETETKQVQNGLLYGFSTAPWVVTVKGQDYAIELRHKSWSLPFTITLDQFIRDLHPRTGMAANFESVVTQTEGPVDRKVNIRMNEPLRYKGYTLFQSGWGPQDAGPGARLFSTFSVVKNPADQWPLYSCIVIAIGLLIHFLQKLFSYLRAENRRRTA